MKSLKPVKNHVPAIVVPLEGTWIEIVVRGNGVRVKGVVPLEGTWIEIVAVMRVELILLVVPLEGTWIEILQPYLPHHGRLASYPLRVRGLKSKGAKVRVYVSKVVPLEGTWIEINRP